jgi:hypothetical protein
MKNLNKILNIYESSIDNNIESIKKILQRLNIDDSEYISKYKGLLDKSSNFITNKWKKRLKYLRTEFILQVFEDEYPRNNLELSIMTDALINILDDILDEELNKNSKTLYIIEILRVISVLFRQDLNPIILKKIGLYFEELITLANYESEILSNVKKTDEKRKIVSLSADLLICRGMDIDIFLDYGINMRLDEDEQTFIKDLSRIYRGLNILKKDIIDIPHDKETNQESLVVHISDRDDYELNLYIRDLLDELIDRKESLDQGIELTHELSKKIYTNFMNLIDIEIKNIKSELDL